VKGNQLRSGLILINDKFTRVVIAICAVFAIFDIVSTIATGHMKYFYNGITEIAVGAVIYFIQRNIEKKDKKYIQTIVNNSITQEHINEILQNSKVTIKQVYDKCTIVSVQLPNGFVLTESSACVDPKNYDEKIGAQICLKRIENKLWELEGYQLQTEIYENN
jgi:hypothetical protein